MPGEASGADAPLRVLVLSDRDIVRRGVAAVLRPYQRRVRVTGEVASVVDALSDAASSGNDVVIAGVRLAEGDGLDEVTSLVEVWGDHRVVVLANPDEARFAQPVLERGAAGFLLLSVSGEELVDRLEQARQEAVVVDAALPAAQGRLDQRGCAALWPGSQLGLSEPQSKVLERLAQGDRTADVAGALGITQLEVKEHLRSAYRQLEVRDRPDALARLARAGVFR